MQKLIFFFFFLNCFFGFSQVVEHTFVKLSTEENGKRLEFYATNTDSIGYSIFLRIVTEDYRRTSNRPILTNIEPNSKTHLITLIKLSGTGGKYKHQFIVNKATQAISFRKDYDKVGDDFNYAFNAKRIVIYQRNDSEVAVEAKMLFLKYKIPFEIYSFEKAKNELKNFKRNKKISKIDFIKSDFILKLDDTLYPSIKTKKELLKILKGGN